MPHRHQAAPLEQPPTKLKPAAALRETLAEGYAPRDFRADLLAGLVVGVIALPLSLALAIASGVPPQHGLYTAIIAGALIALFGGSRFQVSGPTAAFVVILAPIASQFGLGGLLLASIMAGILLLIAGIARLGRLVEFIPYPVTAGFTAGIAVVIASIQFKDFLGLSIQRPPDHFIERVQALYAALPSFALADCAIGLFTLAVLVILPRLTRSIPAPLVALPLAAVIAYALVHYVPDYHVATINSRFSFQEAGQSLAGIPRHPPQFLLPWSASGPGGQPLVLSLDLIRSLMGPAFAIALLGAIESLLSAVVADGMTGRKHDPDAELMAQGLGNIVAPFFGGFAATGAIARTATNIRYGARSPIASVLHAIFILAVVLLLAPLLGHLPMAALAALLFVVAWNMSEARHFVHVLRTAPTADVFVLLICFTLTVIFDMTVSVSAGVILAALLFMRRMVEVSHVKLVAADHVSLTTPVPPGVLIYEIAGPLFFGAAQKAMSALRTIQDGIRSVVIDLRSVPAMDATGLVNLESALERLRKAGIFVVLAGIQKQPLEVIAKAGWHEAHRHQHLAIRRSLEDGLAIASAHAILNQPSPPGEFEPHIPPTGA